jgi:hypothetical protein
MNKKKLTRYFNSTTPFECSLFFLIRLYTGELSRQDLVFERNSQHSDSLFWYIMLYTHTLSYKTNIPSLFLDSIK